MRRTIIITAVAALMCAGAAAQGTNKRSETMDRTEICKKNYTALFGGEALTGQGSDPEMMDILQKFIFGDVFTTGEMDMKMREMVTCVTLASMQTLPQLKAHAGAALNVGVTPEELREAMYLTAPYIGFPRMLNAVGTVNEVLKERGVALPLGREGSLDEKTRGERGQAIRDSLYPGGLAKELSGMPGGMGEDVERFVTEYCFGDIYTRGALDVKTRELLAYCILTAIGAEEQLHPHYHGCLRAGNTPEDVTAAVIQALPYVGFPAALKALMIVKEENAKANGGVPQGLSAFPTGAANDAYAQYFTGRSYLAPLTSDKRLNSPVANVTFEPGCRNNWHSHTGGQILIAVGGRGYYQEKGKPARELLPGDVVEIAPDVVHWHGAAPDSWFSHLAIECNPQSNKNTWLDAVTDEQYREATRKE